MDGMLSQDEINALLSGMSSNDSSGSATDSGDRLTPEEEDALGEVSNISMGTAATTLSTLLNQKVNITTPKVSYMDWNELASEYEKPCVLMHISYIEGLDGNNVLVLKEDDVKIITDLMMGGPGNISEEPLSELHLSAIGEAMNQMMGSASTSMSSLLSRKIDITPPTADLVDMTDEGNYIKPDFLDGTFVKVSFSMQIGDLIDSEIMQLYPLSFAKELYQMFASDPSAAAGGANVTPSEPEPTPAPAPAASPTPAPAPAAATAPAPGQPMAGDMSQQMGYGQPMMGYPQQPMMGYPPQQMYMPPQQNVNVQQAAFTPFNPDLVAITGKENINLIMDVPLEVTVELGRTHKSISDILEFAPGTIVELNKIAGEPIDVLVNGKYVAKGEVVVIEESFGVRITEVIK
ncbi:MAG: flagellar motor switch phosphatase FliY [Lachnospiraceae bacterium]|nr:flagellar motor switch phosphatase FliY [Lachnospiraceae bacterium]